MLEETNFKRYRHDFCVQFLKTIERIILGINISIWFIRIQQKKF